MSNEKLLPCPFCDKAIKRLTEIYCEHPETECVLSGLNFTVESWNTRPTPSLPVSGLREKVKRLKRDLNPSMTRDTHSEAIGFNEAINIFLSLLSLLPQSAEKPDKLTEVEEAIDELVVFDLPSNMYKNFNSAKKGFFRAKYLCLELVRAKKGQSKK